MRSTWWYLNSFIKYITWASKIRWCKLQNYFIHECFQLNRLVHKFSFSFFICRVVCQIDFWSTVNEIMKTDIIGLCLCVFNHVNPMAVNLFAHPLEREILFFHVILEIVRKREKFSIEEKTGGKSFGRKFCIDFG